MGRNGVEVGSLSLLRPHFCHLRAAAVFSAECFDFTPLSIMPFIAVRSASLAELHNPECMHSVYEGEGGGGGGGDGELLIFCK